MINNIYVIERTVSVTVHQDKTAIQRQFFTIMMSHTKLASEKACSVCYRTEESEKTA